MLIKPGYLNLFHGIEINYCIVLYCIVFVLMCSRHKLLISFRSAGLKPDPNLSSVDKFIN